MTTINDSAQYTMTRIASGGAEYSEAGESEVMNVGTTSDLSDLVSQGWLAVIGAVAYRHADVQDVFVSVDESGVDYWIVIPRRDINLVRALVRSQQKDVIELFAKTKNPPFQIDFHISYAEGRKSSEVVPSEVIRIPRP